MTQITIIPMVGDNPSVPAEDAGHFWATMNRALQLSTGDHVEEISIYLSERTKPKFAEDGRRISEGGWLEYTINVLSAGGRLLVIGAIQRRLGEPSEFHS